MRYLLAIVMMVGAGAAAFACSSSTDGSQQATLCDPGENIFCRCRGGSAGTKTCKANGQSFEDCISDTGTCDEIPPPETTSGDPSTSATTSGGATTGGGGGGTGDKGLLAPCAADADCASGSCPMGYCTKDCASYKECVDGDIYGECIRFDVAEIGTVQWCVPYCHLQPDCDAYGEASLCGFTLALDATPFAVCANWGDSLALPPDTIECGETDTICNLGLAGTGRVCALGVCTDGCYGPTDCPNGTSCSSSTNLGVCQ